MRRARRLGPWVLELLRQPTDQRIFLALPRRWELPWPAEGRWSGAVPLATAALTPYRLRPG